MLHERIKILEDAGVISHEVARFVVEVIRLLEPYQFDEAKMEMFTTHLAMATQRIIQSEEELMIDEEIWKQIEMDVKFNDAQVLFGAMAKLSPVEFPIEEAKFLTMHLCNLLQ